MMFSTFGAAIVLLVSLASGRKKKNSLPLRISFLIIFMVLYTYYIISGANDGFATMWVVFIPSLFMILLDVKTGLILSIYFLLLLFLCFYGPLDFLLQFNYPEMMRIRFPVMYLIDFVFSFYGMREIVLARSNLIHARNQMKQASYQDPSTGLKNPSAYIDYVNTAATRTYKRLSVVYLDVNGLHEMNNRLGHAAGDKMLRFVADALREQFPQDNLFRLGGDEFLVISPLHTEEEITEQMKRMNRKIEAEGYAVAYGIEYRESDFNIEEMVNCADAKMLQNKSEYYRAQNRHLR
ncbi:MAG: GGDEF domain-containing protein [Candidatus Choladocola sp.]|nr:GGDEF domain-containing protein [Candidatus Choladocola sp.]